MKRSSTLTGLLMMLFALLTLPSTAQDNLFNGDAWINKEGNVEMTPQKAIDNSKIVSDWKRRKDTMDSWHQKLQRKDSIIAALENEAKQSLARINELTDYIVTRNREIDSISTKQIEAAMNWKSRLSLLIEANTNIQEFEDIQLNSRLVYPMRKVYIFGEGTVGRNDFYRVSVGVGYKILGK